MSCIFRLWTFMPYKFGSSFSCPAISCPAYWSVNFMSCNFMSCNFDGPSFWCPAFSVNPWLALRQTATSLTQDSVTRPLCHLIKTVQCSLVVNGSDCTRKCMCIGTICPPPSRPLTQLLHFRTANALGGCIWACDWVIFANLFMLADWPSCIGRLVHCTVHCK